MKKKRSEIQIKSRNESEIDEVKRNSLCRLFLFTLAAGETWKAPKCKSRFYGFSIPSLVFNEKLCETTILKFINERENM